MTDDPEIPLPVRWRTALPARVKLPPLDHDGALVVRCGADLLALDPATGAVRWSVRVAEAGDVGSFLAAVGDLVVTDARPGKERLTELVAVKAGAIVRRVELGCIVPADAAAVMGDELFVLGGEAAIGTVLRSVAPATGARRVDRKVEPNGRDLLRVGERLLILDATGGPGLHTVDRDGGDRRVIEETPVQAMRAAGGRLIASLRVGDYPKRETQVRDLASWKVLWSRPSHGPLVGLGDDLAIHVEAAGDGLIPVARDPATGAERWRGPALADDSGAFAVCGPIVAFSSGGTTTLLRGDDGASLGEVEQAGLMARVGGRLYLGGFRFLAAVDPP